jgi:hypothetical protein
MIIECQLLSIIDEDRNVQPVSLAESFLTVNKKFDENSYVRMTAARSLGMFSDPRVIDPLIQALRDESHGLQKNAILSLKERTGQDFGKDYEAWRRWWEQNK